MLHSMELKRIQCLHVLKTLLERSRVIETVCHGFEIKVYGLAYWPTLVISRVLDMGATCPSPSGVSKWRANEARLNGSRGILSLYDHIGEK